MRPLKYTFPNVRKLFVPDKGKLIFDMDLVGADATVAAKECGGQYWSDIVAGRKINVDILEHCYPEVYRRWKDCPPDPPGKEGYRDSLREPFYTKCKNMHYGSIYTGGPAGIGSAAAIPEGIVQNMQTWFFGKYPTIKGWHDRTDLALQTKRKITNAFGYHVLYFDRVERLLPEAVNWICQSTVAIVCQRGSLVVAREFPEVELLLQVHDSLVGQLPIRGAGQVLTRLKARLDRIPVPYPEPLYIPWGLKVSDKSWGHCTDEFYTQLVRVD